MATEFKTKEDEDKDKAEGLAGSTGAVAASPGGQVSAGGANPVANRTPSNRPNINQYLQANQGAGQTLQQGIQGQTQKQAQKLGAEVGKTQQQLESSSQPLAQKLGEEGSQKIQTAFKDPNALLNQQDQLAEFQKLRSQGYQGDINTLGQTVGQQQQVLSSQAGQLGQKAELAGTEAGRFELLRGAYGQPTYSKGQQRLDQLFLQAQPGVARSLQQNLGQVSQQAGQQVSALDTAAQAKLQALQGLSSERANQWNNLLTSGASEGLEEDISQRGLSDIQASSEARLAQAQQDVAGAAGLRERLATNKVTDEDIQKLGLQKGQSLYDVNLGNYMNQGDREATLAGTADANEVARYRALQQLSGDTSGDIFGGAQDIGGFKAYDYDKIGLQSALDKSKQTYEVDKVNAYLDSMKNAGYFKGASGGSGMQSSDPAAAYRPRVGNLINQAREQQQQGLPEGQQYSDTILDALKKGWAGYGGWGQNAYNRVSGLSGVDLFKQLNKYIGQDLTKQRGNVIGGSALEDEDPFKVK